MTIGWDARFYGSEITGGIGRYIAEVLVELEMMDQENDYIIFLNKENWDLYYPKNKRFKKVLVDIPWYSLREQYKMPAIISQYNIDLMHFPHFNVPVFYRGKFVVTIHDLILLDYPSKKGTQLSFWHYWLKEKAYKYVIKHAVKKSHKIFTVSEYSKTRILKYFSIKKDKVLVTPLGVRKKDFDQKENSPLMMKHNIKEKFLLYVGNAYPHKNLSFLLQAYREYCNASSFPLQLIFVGADNLFYQELKREAQQNGLLEGNNAILFTGAVSEKELVFLYKKAYWYIFPSLWEGFGLPGLEAFSYNVPVMASNRTALPEVLGDAALYFDPELKPDLIEKLLHVEKASLKERKNWIEKGKKQLKKYSWKKCAISILDNYR